MKNVLFCLLMGSLFLNLLSCDKEEKAARKEEKPVMKVEEPVIPSAKFSSFVNGFESGLRPNVYDQAWLETFLDNNKVREISPKVCEDFIHGKEIWNHGFDQQPKKQLSADKPYYYIGQIADAQKYIMLIFSDLEENATETYLCTYAKDGAFLSGIVLQAQYRGDAASNAVNEMQRISRIPADTTPVLIIEETTNEAKTSTLEYTISSEGYIQPKQHAS